MRIFWLLFIVLDTVLARRGCPIRKYELNGECLKCHSFCAQCIGPEKKDCTECAASYRIGENLDSKVFECSVKCNNNFSVPIKNRKYQLCRQLFVGASKNDLENISQKIENLIFKIIIIGTIIVIFLILLLFVAFFLIWRGGFQRQKSLLPLSDEIQLIKMEQKVENIGSQNLNINKEKRIGYGGFGEVYEGVYKPPNGEEKKVAVKTIQSNQDLKAKLQLFDELRNMAKITPHPHVIPLLGVNMESELKLIMPRLKCDLKKHLCLQYLQNQRLENDLLNRFCSQIADGMKHLHSLKILHCDLKILNVLVKDDMCVQISDFGLACHRNQNTFKSGTYTHVALELLNGTTKNYTNKTDVWAYGVTVWEIWQMGQLQPYAENAKNQAQLIKFLQSGNRLEQPDGIKIDYWQLIMRCFNADPNIRPTFKELYSVFADVIIETSSAEDVIEISAENGRATKKFF